MELIEVIGRFIFNYLILGIFGLIIVGGIIWVVFIKIFDAFFRKWE